MQRLARLLIPLALFITALSCGAPPEPERIGPWVAELNGFSQYPVQNEPWLCSGPVAPYPAWMPNISPWPMNTINSWCQWQPASWETSSQYPYQVWSCDLAGNPNPPWHGSAYLFNADSFAGDCANIWGGTSAQPLAAYQYDADVVELNGWHSTWTPAGGSASRMMIRSIKMAPYTRLILCPGPLTGPASQPCQTSPAVDVTTTSLGATFQYGVGFLTEIAAIQIQATQ